MQLVQDTPEHARAAAAMKSAYLRLPRADQCVRLSDHFQRAFEYLHPVKLRRAGVVAVAATAAATAAATKTNDGSGREDEMMEKEEEWEAVIWDPEWLSTRGRASGDFVVAVDIAPIVLVRTVRARLLAVYAISGETVELWSSSSSSYSCSSPVEISVPLGGIPTVALSHCSLKVVVVTVISGTTITDDDWNVVVRRRVVPSRLRRSAALERYDLGGYVVRCGVCELKRKASSPLIGLCRCVVQ